MFSLEDQEQRTGIEAPAPGECFCHLLAGHPHASTNDLCEVCKAEYEEWSNQLFELPPASVLALLELEAAWQACARKEVN